MCGQNINFTQMKQGHDVLLQDFLASIQTTQQHSKFINEKIKLKKASDIYYFTSINPVTKFYT